MNDEEHPDDGTRQRIRSLHAQREEARQAGNRRDVARCDLDLGLIHDALGEYKTALTRFRSARDMYKDLHDAGRAADCDHNLGNVYLHLSRFNDALDSYTSARGAYICLKDWEGTADCQLGLGNVHASLRQAASAVACLDSARMIYQALFQLSGDPALKSKVAGSTLNLGSALLAMQSHAEARNCYLAARQAYSELGEHAERAGCDQNLGLVDFELGDYAQAGKRFRAALKTFIELGLDAEAAACEHSLGGIDFASGRYLSARQHYASARVLHSTDSWVELASVDIADGLCLVSLADASEMFGRLAEATDAFREALGLLVPAALALDSVRFQLGSTPARQSWAEFRVADGMNVALLVAHHLGDTDLLAELIESSRAFGRLDLPETGRPPASVTELSLNTNGTAAILDTTRHTLNRDSGDRSRGPHQEGDSGSADLSAVLPMSTTDSSGLRLRPPGRVRLPWRTEPALIHHHHSAQSRYGHTNTTLRPVYPLAHTLT